MGYPKNTAGEENRLKKRREEEKEIKKNNQQKYMKEIAQIRKLSIWIFLIPIVAINLCLIISQNAALLENTIFAVDPIGYSNFSIPYLDGSLSISRASRTFPQYLVFKPSMFLTAIFLYYYWRANNNLVNNLNSTSRDHKFKTFGILSAVFLVIHSIFLGIKFDIQLYKLFRRVVLLLFIIFEIIAQGILVYHFYKLKIKLEKFIVKSFNFKNNFSKYFNSRCSIKPPILISKGNTTSNMV